MGGDLARFIGSIPVIDVHEHHVSDENPGRQIGLRQLLEESYAGWTQKRPYPLPGEPRVTLGSTSPPQASMSIWKAFGDCVVDRLCRLAGERDIPFQMHLGSALTRAPGSCSCTWRIPGPESCSAWPFCLPQHLDRPDLVVDPEPDPIPRSLPGSGRGPA